MWIQRTLLEMCMPWVMLCGALTWMLLLFFSEVEANGFEVPMMGIFLFAPGPPAVIPPTTGEDWARGEPFSGGVLGLDLSLLRMAGFVVFILNRRRDTLIKNLLKYNTAT
jgi:hypothetical protein